MIKPEKLLIVRTDRIGDVVLSLPLAKIIKDKYPQCKITFLIREYTQSLVKNHPYIDNYLILKEKNGQIPISENADQIKKLGFDSSVIVYPTFRTALIIFLAGIKNRIGTGYRWYSLLFNKKVYEHRKYAEKHELEFNVNLLKFFGIKKDVNRNNVEFDLSVTEKNIIKVRDILIKQNIDFLKPIIIVHPGSAGSAVDLPVDKFEELIKLLNKNLDVQILLTGLESEKELCSRLIINDKIKNFAGMFDLEEMIALIDLSSLFISNSTGPLHIAAALGKNVIGFYPKVLSCSAKRWGPYSNKGIVFEPEINCENCTTDQCEKLDCMNSINMEKVFIEVEKIYRIVVN